MHSHNQHFVLRHILTYNIIQYNTIIYIRLFRRRVLERLAAQPNTSVIAGVRNVDKANKELSESSTVVRGAMIQKVGDMIIIYVFMIYDVNTLCMIYYVTY